MRLAQVVIVAIIGSATGLWSGASSAANQQPPACAALTFRHPAQRVMRAVVIGRAAPGAVPRARA